MLKKNLTGLRTFMMGHVVPLTWYSPGFVDGQDLKTVAGNKIKVGVGSDGEFQINKLCYALNQVFPG
jgi:hypothetical protein